LSDYPQALKSGNQALTIAQDIKSSAAELMALSALTSSYKALGDYPKAITTNQQILALARQSYNQPMEGITLLELGEIASNQAWTQRINRFWLDR
ncbi:MAG: tetratricopeptide repeat protein, partial [Kovacikia sp.]